MEFIKNTCPRCGDTNIEYEPPNNYIKCFSCGFHASQVTWKETIWFWNDQPLVDKVRDLRRDKEELVKLWEEANRIMSKYSIESDKGLEECVERNLRGYQRRYNMFRGLSFAACVLGIVLWAAFIFVCLFGV